LNAEVQAATASGGLVPGRLGPDGQSLVITPALRNAIDPFLGVGAVTSINSGLEGGVAFDLETHQLTMVSAFRHRKTPSLLILLVSMLISTIFTLLLRD